MSDFGKKQVRQERGGTPFERQVVSLDDYRQKHEAKKNAQRAKQALAQAAAGSNLSHRQSERIRYEEGDMYTHVNPRLQPAQSNTLRIREMNPDDLERHLSGRQDQRQIDRNCAIASRTMGVKLFTSFALVSALTMGAGLHYLFNKNNDTQVSSATSQQMDNRPTVKFEKFDI